MYIQVGSKVVVVGKSGIGKSTLAKIIVGLEKAWESSVGYHLSKHRGVQP